MGEAEANLDQEGDKWLPRQVTHARLGLRWTVLEVLESWTHPGWPRGTYGKPVIERRYRLLVHGPLPRNRAREGEFVMVATPYGDRDRWQIRPDDRPGPMTQIRGSWYRKDT